jgi:hypothetical protein
MKESEKVYQEKFIGILTNEKPVNAMIAINESHNSELENISIKKQELTEKGFVFKDIVFN